MLDHRTTLANSPVAALVHVQIARAYALQGDTAKAKAAYEDFVALWKDADPDIPILKRPKPSSENYSRLLVEVLLSETPQHACLGLA